MCEEDPTLDEPWCVKVCKVDALTYEEYEEEVEEAEPQVKRDEIEVGFEQLIDRHGKQKVLDTIARMLRKS